MRPAVRCCSAFSGIRAERPGCTGAVPQDKYSQSPPRLIFACPPRHLAQIVSRQAGDGLS
jgi:hypothetical protein